MRYALKMPDRDGTTHVVFEALDFIARLAAPVPTPRVHLTRYHGVFALHSRWRSQIPPAGRGRFRGGSSRTGAQVPCVTGGSSAPPPGPGFRQGLGMTHFFVAIDLAG